MMRLFSSLPPARPALVALLAVALAAPAVPVRAAGEAAPPPSVDWSFDGPFGVFDRNALRRGFKVYQEVCSSCHSLQYLHYRDLSAVGGPEFTEEQVKVIAAEHVVQDGPDEFGDMFERPALPRDRFVSPFANPQAARAANGGALPPDLSLMVNARPNGANYLYGLLTGYGGEPPEDMSMDVGQHYNPMMSGSLIAMAPPLVEGIVEYTDGTPADVDTMARDVTEFLAWAANPHLETRKRIGFQTMIYLLILAGLLYFATKKLWRGRSNPDDEQPASD